MNTGFFSRGSSSSLGTTQSPLASIWREVCAYRGSSRSHKLTEELPIRYTAKAPMMAPAIQPRDGCRFNFNGGAGYRFVSREPNRTPLDHRPAHPHPTPHKMNFIILGSL